LDEFGEFYDETEEDETEEEQDAKIDAFMEWLSELEAEYFSEPRLRIVNPKRLRQFQYAFYKISEIIKETNPNAEIEYTLNNIADIGHAAIRIETDELSTTKPQELIEAIKFASDVEVFPLTDGNIRLILGFKGMLDDINVEE